MSTLLEALLAVQAEAPALQKERINESFGSKYIPLESLMPAVLPILVKHGLVWTTLPCFFEGQPALSYRLRHVESGESYGDTMPLMLARNDPQGQGSAITYARRYSLMAVLGLVADVDDDGNHASPRQPSADPPRTTAPIASAKQRSLIFARAGARELSMERLAMIVQIATGSEAKSFASQEEAGSWLRRALDRLPMVYVDGILDGIADA